MNEKNKDDVVSHINAWVSISAVIFAGMVASVVVIFASL